ncbi:ERCC4 domain-containing protein [Clostridium butyricum]|uniref:ERCC4 domain-containing protein n=1 Tax=Clostridium butyricum TaxID=1492 RepID=UPI0013D0573F|nr:ERCC4 domain-containing protein [Clostridium butyricum]MCQ2016771.1 ERCC4 domain-containing protein [Clostridium butyricum]MCQ2020661.1 ERCC4 domain-containing protein [Clostridium butyricum]NFB69574.1 ERCC4-type nuclease [Clostridium butyricum]NFB90371.1 ERCC4-type nuclease [Clostridium butyricum]UTY54162.1 ERCC4-type nuclease [Clostridium butyricum]
MRYRYTDKEMKKILDNMVVIVDSREQNNQHIIEFFNKKNIPYKTIKNDFGDYTAMLPAGTLTGFTSDIYFDRDIAIERKNSIDEIAGNLKEDAARIKKELAHMNKYDIKYFFFVEDKNFHENLRNGNFRSQYDPFTLMQRIKKGIEAEYNTVIVPIDKKFIGSEIYYTLQAFVYNLFKHKGFILEEEGEEIEN